MSDKQQHTPGPWRPVRSQTCGHLRASHNYREDPHQEWTDADLRLIAAAPRLLATLRELYDYSATSTDPRFSVRSNIAHETAWKLLRELEGK